MKNSFGKIIYNNTQGFTHEEINISWNWIQKLKKKHKPKTHKRNKKPKIKKFENKKKSKTITKTNNVHTKHRSANSCKPKEHKKRWNCLSKKMNEESSTKVTRNMQQDEYRI
jgi:hypothetical protein